MTRMIQRKLLLLFLALLGFTGITLVFGGGDGQAYVTLLYGEEFVLGVRVLGKSIRDTGSRKDMVVLVSDGVSSFSQMLLQTDGWIVEHITLLENPNQVRPERFWGVYTKLKIFNMTRYKKVVYLDADTIVVKSIEELFMCGKFCANLKHSERLNSGVLVVEPSNPLFLDMMAKVNTLPSYTGGDQGFLNSYFTDFANARVFEPGSRGPTYSGPLPEMERLSTIFNADVGLYMLANKWMVDEKELHVIHYTLGPLKPWDWWTAWLLRPVHVWQSVREKLEERVPGTGGGQNPVDSVTVKILFTLPFLALLVAYHRPLARHVLSWSWRNSVWDHAGHMCCRFRHGGGCGFSSYSAVSTSSSSSSCQQVVPWFLGGASVVACFLCAAVAFVAAALVVPRQVLPWTGLLLMFEWGFAVFFALFKAYLHLVHLWGIRAASLFSLLSGPVPDHHRTDKDEKRKQGSEAEANYWVGMAAMAISVPSLPSLLHITPLFSRLGLMVGGGMMLGSFMTLAADRLSTLAFLRGAATGPRGRSSFC